MHGRILVMSVLTLVLAGSQAHSNATARPADVIEVRLAHTPDDYVGIDIATQSSKPALGHIDVVIRNVSDKTIEIMDIAPNPGDPDVELSGTCEGRHHFTVIGKEFLDRMKTIMVRETLEPGDVAVRPVTFDPAQFEGWPALPEVSRTTHYTLAAKFKATIQIDSGDIQKIESAWSPAITYRVEGCSTGR